MFVQSALCGLLPEIGKPEMNYKLCSLCVSLPARVWCSLARYSERFLMLPHPRAKDWLHCCQRALSTSTLVKFNQTLEVTVIRARSPCLCAGWESSPVPHTDSLLDWEEPTYMNSFISPTAASYKNTEYNLRGNALNAFWLLSLERHSLALPRYFQHCACGPFI